MNQWSRWDKEGQALNAGPGSPAQAWRWLAQALGMPALLATPMRALGDIALPPSRLTPAMRAKFAALLGDNGLRDDAAARLDHAEDGVRLRAGDLTRVPDAVLYPRKAEDAAALLALCAEAGIAAHPRDGVFVAVDLARMDGLSVDAVSGLAEVEAGAGGAVLAQRLAAMGLSLGEEDFVTLGARAAENPPWLVTAQLATPRGLVSHAPGRVGLVTGATVRVTALPAHREQRGYLFPDFASGLAALREAGRQGLVESASLSDAGETRFQHGMARTNRRFGLRQRLAELHRDLRRFDHQAAALQVRFSGSARDVAAKRRSLDALAYKLGAMRQSPLSLANRRSALLDHGVGMDAVRATASWTAMPLLYARARAALDQAMRSNVPPASGAHGLVLGRVSHPRPDGAILTLGFAYPRWLGNDVAQSVALRAAADAALGSSANALEQELARAERRLLDPAGVLAPF